MENITEVKHSNIQSQNTKENEDENKIHGQNSRKVQQWLENITEVNHSNIQSQNTKENQDENKSNSDMIPVDIDKDDYLLVIRRKSQEACKVVSIENSEVLHVRFLKPLNRFKTMFELENEEEAIEITTIVDKLGQPKAVGKRVQFNHLYFTVKKVPITVTSFI